MGWRDIELVFAIIGACFVMFTMLLGAWVLLIEYSRNKARKDSFAKVHRHNVIPLRPKQVYWQEDL